MTRQPVILYVEDEENDVFFMRRAFQKIAVDVSLHCVADGLSAISYLAGRGMFADRLHHPLPDTLLLDVNLPGCSGFDVLNWLRQEPQFAELPVVMFSSSLRSEDIERARALGANDYLQKPGTGLDFPEVARQLQQGWSAARP